MAYKYTKGSVNRGDLYAESSVDDDGDTYINFGSDSISLVANAINTLAVGTAGVVINEGGVDAQDFRVESDNATHLLFVDAGTEAVSIGDSTNAPAGVLEISQQSTAGLPGLKIATADVDQKAVEIVASQTTANVLDITANALTSGDAISVASSDSNTTARALLKLSNSNSAAVATIPIEIVQADVAEGDIISAAVGGNGSVCALRVLEKSVTCSTSDTTTESASFFPALSVPVALGIRVTTAITNNAYITKIGYEHDASSFAGSDDGSQDLGDGELEAAGTTSITGNGGNLVFHQATDLLITHNATPGAGVVRIAYYYYKITAPTS
jgi:hypothetical protein